MRRIMVGLIILILVVAAGPLTLANVNQFTGRWTNSDSNTRGITALDIQANGSNVTVQAWGKCSPTDCDWGRVAAYAYAPDVQSNLATSAQALSAVFDTNFSQTLIIIHSANGNRLEAEVLTHFTDGSGRSNYQNLYTFNRGLQVITKPVVITRPLATPTQVSPPSGKVFNRYPRQTTLRWEEVPGAASYTVEIDYFAANWITDSGKTYIIAPNLTDTSYTFNFVGAQPGRWRVWAVGPTGQESPKSGWWEFSYTK
jgi:hypothetical protein